MPPAINKPHSAGKYSGLASNLAHLGRMRLSPGLGSSCRMANDASRGVGNSSAQTVDAHVPREWEEPASEALREGWSEAEVCAEEVAAPRKPMWQHREATPQRKARHLRESNLPNQQHRDEQPTEPVASGRGCFGTKWCQKGRC